MSNKISRRAFLKVTGVSALALCLLYTSDAADE